MLRTPESGGVRPIALWPDPAGAARSVPLIDERLLAAGLAVASDDGAAVRQDLARDFVHRLGACPPGLLGSLRAVTERRRNPITLFLGTAVANDDLVAGGLRAGIPAEHLDRRFACGGRGRVILGQGGRGGGDKRREDKQPGHISVLMRGLR